MANSCGYFLPENDTIFVYVSGCSGISVSENEVEKPTVYIPNVFSPNGDGINDFFEIKITETLNGDLQLTIYDRWGSMVYKNKQNPPQPWDGNCKNNVCGQGVYFYTLRYSHAKNSTPYFWQGSLTFMR